MEELTIPVYPRPAMVGILVMAITRFHQTIRHLSDPIVIAKLDILAQNVFKRQWICNMSGYIQRTIKQHINRLRVVTVPFLPLCKLQNSCKFISYAYNSTIQFTGYIQCKNIVLFFIIIFARNIILCVWSIMAITCRK